MSGTVTFDNNFSFLNGGDLVRYLLTILGPDQWLVKCAPRYLYILIRISIHFPLSIRSLQMKLLLPKSPFVIPRVTRLQRSTLTALSVDCASIPVQILLNVGILLSGRYILRESFSIPETSLNTALKAVHNGRPFQREAIYSPSSDGCSTFSYYWIVIGLSFTLWQPKSPVG